MSVYEEGTHDRLALINIKLGELDNNVNKYFDNYNIEQLAHVITTVNAKIESSGIENAKWDVDMTTLRSRVDLEKCSKQEYHELIEICNQLWIVNGLLIEATHQADFEHRVQSYLKLKKKVDTLKHNSDGINTSSLKIIHKLEDKVDELKNDLVSYMKNQFIKYLNIDDRDAQIVYVGNIDDVQFITFLKLCKQVITVSLNDFFKLTTNLNSWLEIIFEKLQQGNVDFFSFTATNDGVLKLQPEHGAADFLHFVKSIEEIISFSNQVIFETNEIDDFNNVRISTGKLILKKLKSKIFEKENVYPLIVDKLNYDESTNSEISSISALYKISNLLSQPGWSKDGICELEFWLDDLTTSWVDNLVNCTIDRLKEFVIKFTNEGFDARLKDSNLISVEIDVQQCNKEQVATNGNKAVDEDDGGWGNEWDNNEEWNDDVNSTNKDELTEAEEVEDDGGWGHEELDIDINSITDQVKKTEEEQIQPNEDDGGWSDDDLDLDIDSVNETKKREEEEEEEDNDGWSAWDNEVKISANDISGSSETQHNSEGNKFIIPTYKYSTLVNELINIFENYMKNYEDLLELHVNQEQNEQAKDLFKHGFKKLCISYFMMIEQEVNETYQNEILFYNDFNKLLEECYNKYDVDLTTCYRMNFNSLNQFMNQYTSQLISIIEDYDISIWNDNDFENDDKLAMYSKEFLIRYDTQLDKILLDLSELSKFNTQLITNILLTIIFKSFNILCDKILRRSDISSYESEILSGIIDHLTTHISQETHNLNIKVEKIQTLNKLQQIKLILSSNLKEILDLFYDAKLYELETQELTSLILSLFVESPQRSKTIEEIKTIRETKF